MTQIILELARRRLDASALVIMLAVFMADARGQDTGPAEPHVELIKKAIVDAKVPPESPKDPEPATTRPAALRHGASAWIYNTTETRAIRALIYAASVQDEYGSVKPAAGRSLLVLDVQFENIIPLTLIYDKQVPTEYQVPNLADHVYLVIDGAFVARLHPAANELPGHIKVRDFKLERIGEKVRGNLVFDAPLAEARTVALRYYDYAHGHMALKLAGTDEAFAANEAAKPIQKPSKNEVVEAGVFAMEKLAELNGTKAPDGMIYVVADLRARSMFTFPGDATAFDPKAKPGAKIEIGTVADWNEAYRYLQLVVDGERAYMPIVPGTTLPEAPRFLPDVMTGGKVAFLAPSDAKSLELRCDFPNAKPPGGGANFRPRGITLALEGKRPPQPSHKPIASVRDDVYQVSVTGQSTPQTFAGAQPPQGRRFLVLDILVDNRGQQGELFQTKEQLKAATSDGAQVEVDPATFQGKYRPTELVFIPPHERRTFQVAYAIPAAETRPRLAYGGISLAKNLDLQPIEAAPGAVAAANPAPANAADAPAPANAAADKPAHAEPAKPQAAEPKTQVAANVPAKPEPPKVTPEKTIKQADARVLRVPAKQPHEPKGLAGVGLKAEQVNQAIDLGAAFLWNYIKEKELANHYQLGYRQEHMPAALALVHAGAHKKFPDFDAAVRKYIATFDPLASTNTYMNGIYCMLIDAYGDPTYMPQMRKTAQWLVDTQGPEGTWGYGFRRPGDEKPADAVVVRRVLQVAGGQPLDQPAGGEPIVRTLPWEKGADGDNSVTQYALLGLHAAGRFGVEIPKETWERTLKEHRARQDEKEGGFGYTSASPGYSYGSMTCAGVCAMALARFELGEKDFAADEHIERGIAWMSNFFTVAGNPQPDWKNQMAMNGEWHYYYLYSLERVGRILDTEFIGPHEWYPLGAKYLLSNQLDENGGWLSEQDNNDPVLSTAFALLFLTRATESLELPEREGPGTLKTGVVTPPGQKVYIILDGSGTMMEENNGVPRFEVARAAMAKLTEELSKTSEVGLRVFGHRKSSIQPGADEDTELVAPLSRQGREQAIAALQALRPRGKTPLTRTLLEAASDVKGKGTADDPVTVLLVTDGGEDNTKPPMPPVEAAKALGELPGVRWFVVGFDVDRPEWVKQLDGLARSGGGQYLSASDGEALHREMRAAILGTPESFQVLDEKGRPMHAGAFGDALPLPAGKYTFQTSFGGQPFAQEFWINPAATTAITFDAAAVATDTSSRVDAPVAAQPAPGAPPAPAGPAPAEPAPAGAKKFCTSCGNQLKPDARFCTSCGAKAGG